MKTCPKCHQSLPATAAHFHRNARRSDGLDLRCKKCKSAEAEALKLARIAGKWVSKRIPPKERIAKHVQIDANGCWIWQLRKSRLGYGRVNAPPNDRRRGRIMTAHRFAYEVYVGPIPPGMFVCHSCDNPPCCNPAHLWLGTAADNTRDMIAKGRGRWAQKFKPEALAWPTMQEGK